MAKPRVRDQTKNALFFGNSLEIVRRHVSDGTVDLDPPFNSKRDYSLLFKEEDDPRRPSGRSRPADVR